MGRSGASQRQKKAEKAKVKLKGHATKFLPKGKNVTNTTFKVRKIVLQEQLKTPDGSQPLSRRKLNVKEVLSRLQHYSSSQRQEGLVGLSELLNQMDMGQLTSHLFSIMDSLARLSLDPESSVRKQSAHILTSVFSLVNEAQLMPFCQVLGSYLSCAMTHIQLKVQEDSLLLFDAILEHAPALAAASANQLLPCVLDMISRSRSDHQSGRQLSVQLSSNITSSIWRAKVFGRLQALLIVSLKKCTDNGSPTRNLCYSAHHSSVPVSKDCLKELKFPLYNSNYATPLCLSTVFHKLNRNTKQLIDEPSQFKTFVESLMPLMFDSWLEVNPSTLKKSKGAEDNGLQLESALTLHCVLEIINLLWEHLVSRGKANSRTDLTEWFKVTYVKDFHKYLGTGFPYEARLIIEEESKDTSQGHGRRRSKPEKTATPDASLFKLASPFFLKDKDEKSCNKAIGKCILQNLILCHLLANMIESPTAAVKGKLLGILITYLNQWDGSLSPWSDHLLRALRSVFEKSRLWGCDLDPLLAAVVQRYHRSSAKQTAAHQLLASELCDLLGEIPVLENLQHLQKCESLSSWVSLLPSSLSSGNISLNKLCLFNKLACQNNAAFLNGLQNSFPSLLAAVVNFETSEGENRLEKEAGLASLFYWFPFWTDTQLLSLEEVLTENQSSLAKKIANILLIRSDKFEIFRQA
ncbi:testis-expressed protein 10 [Frankliniella occidentalis]|uniref:Testis-expressed protein 10 n=1 Tax=Frankliniella occidentalis TaxID=133901 RepID=A0A6J1SKI2_FRAOC|nr:testis-expressed protein 10 [Frankliniella occidentalis]